MGGVVLKSRPEVSMKKGAVWFVELVPGGTVMFWVTQAGCAIAAGMSHVADRSVADRNVPARTANGLFMLFPRMRRVSLARLRGKTLSVGRRAVNGFGFS